MRNLKKQHNLSTFFVQSIDIDPQAAKEARSKELAKARYEKRKAEKREFTARKKAGLLTPEELEAEEKRLAHNRE